MCFGVGIVGTAGVKRNMHCGGERTAVGEVLCTAGWERIAGAEAMYAIWGRSTAHSMKYRTYQIQSVSTAGGGNVCNVHCTKYNINRTESPLWRWYYEGGGITLYEIQ